MSVFPHRNVTVMVWFWGVFFLQDNKMISYYSRRINSSRLGPRVPLPRSSCNVFMEKS